MMLQEPSKVEGHVTLPRATLPTELLGDEAILASSKIPCFVDMCMRAVPTFWEMDGASAA